jgi:hypothetical protein
VRKVRADGAGWAAESGQQEWDIRRLPWRSERAKRKRRVAMSSPGRITKNILNWATGTVTPETQ